MEKGDTVLGINTSHDTAVAVVKDGEVKHVYEEERSRRSKYWSPAEDSGGKEAYEELGLLCIDHKQLHSPEYLAFASFDRRDFNIDIQDSVRRDKLLQQEIVSAFAEQQVSRGKLQEIQDRFGPVSYTHLTLPTKRIV